MSDVKLEGEVPSGVPPGTVTSRPREKVGELGEELANYWSMLSTSMHLCQTQHYALQRQKVVMWGMIGRSFGLDVERERYELELVDGVVVLWRWIERSSDKEEAQDG